MKNTHEIFLISDSTGETIDRIFTALKAQFKDFSYKTQQFSFTRTENQILEILKEAKTKKNIIILYTLVDQKLALFLNELSKKNNIPCFGVLGELIENFSKILNNQSLNWAFKAVKILSIVSPVESEIRNISCVFFMYKI